MAELVVEKEGRRVLRCLLRVPLGPAQLQGTPVEVADQLVANNDRLVLRGVERVRGPALRNGNRHVHRHDQGAVQILCQRLEDPVGLQLFLPLPEHRIGHVRVDWHELSGPNAGRHDHTQSDCHTPHGSRKIHGSFSVWVLKPPTSCEPRSFFLASYSRPSG